ncbi:unnamed protein product [Coregonus sp. 'balchen']|nr:unnamed protein product [Coregonus sp. 'balchen']
MSHNIGFREKDHKLKTFHSIEPIAARISFHGKVCQIMNTEIRSKDLVTQRPSYSLTVTIRPSDHQMDRLNCSHKYQPPLVISTTIWHNPFPGYNVVWNPSNNSYDLLIENITGSDLGLYYCGTKETNVVEEGKGGITQKGETTLIEQKEVYHYGNITTRISLDVSPPESPSSSPDVDCGLCWMLLFSLCPVSALLSSLLSSSCVYYFCRTTAAAETQVPLNRTTTRGSDSREKV